MLNSNHLNEAVKDYVRRHNESFQPTKHELVNGRPDFAWTASQKKDMLCVPEPSAFTSALHISSDPLSGSGKA